MGDNFCHVSKIRPEDRGIPCVTSGTQKWNGAIPSFMVRAIVMSIEATGLNSFITVHWPEYIRSSNYIQNRREKGEREKSICKITGWRGRSGEDYRKLTATFDR